MQRIVPHLWFDSQAEEAANFYVALFGDSRIVNVDRYGESGSAMAGKVPGSVMTVTFQLAGQDFIALNGGPLYKFTPALSLLVNCGTQAEIDRLWERLTDGGEPMPCGWLTDRFGVTWQIVPSALERMIQDKDRQRAERVMKVLLTMTKIDIAALELAYRGD